MSDIDHVLKAIQALRGDIREEVKSTITTELTKFKGEIITIVDTKLADIKADIRTLDGKVAALDTKVTALDKKVTALDIKVTKLDARVTLIEKRVGALETTVGVLGKKVVTLETTVGVLGKKVVTLETTLNSLGANVRIHSKRDTRIQETKNELAVYNYLTTKIPSSTFVKTNRYTVYDSSGNNITELDGCILMNPTITPETITNRDLAEFREVIDSGISTVGAHQLTIIIESKSSLNTPRVNETLRHAIEIENMLKSLDTVDMTSAHDKFVMMVEDNNVRAYPKIVNMVFASDDISAPLRGLITDINNGTLTDISYNEYIIGALIKDSFYIELINDTRISDTERKQLEELVAAKDFDAIRAKCAANVYGKRSRMLAKYIVPFSDINTQIYLPMKGKIGILEFDKLIMPHVVNTLGTLGGAGAPKTRKRGQPKK